MNADEKTAVATPNPCDNLEVIEGVGPGYAKALNKIGVCHYADLARFSTPEELHEALLTEGGVNVPLWKIENSKGQKGSWLQQAENLAQAAASPSKTGVQMEDDNDAWQEHAFFSVRIDRKTDADGQLSWRTWVYREQNGGAQAWLPGVVAPFNWVNWILEHANLPFAWEPLTTPSAVEREVVKMAEIEIEMAAEDAADEADEIVLQRGGRDLRFKKVPNAFAVRLKQGQAADEAALESTLGRVEAQVQHLETNPLERLDVFRVETAVQLEETMDQLRQASGADVVTHIYEVDETPASGLIPTGTLTLQFAAEASKEAQEAILAEFGLEIVAELDFIPGGYTVSLTDASTENPLKIAAKLQAHADVALAEPDLAVPTSYEYRPADTLYQDQWHLHNRGDRVGLKAGADVKAEAAWEATRGRREITICVMDDGFDLGHPEFDIPNKVVAERDFGQNDFNPAPVRFSDNHGTACAGVAVAEENGEGVVGLAPRCSLMPLRMGSISDNAIVAYFQYAMDNGADVISCSWSARPWNFPLSAKMKGIITKAATQGRNGKGCVILFAAGNQSRPLDGFKNGRVSHQGFALHPDVLAIAASNSLDEHASYSNHGSELAICAPSSGSPGRRIVTTDRRGIRGYESGDYTDGFGGTSSSTPLVAGLAGLILSLHPELTAVQVKEIMMETADKIDQNNGRYNNGHSPLYGHGRINAERAIARTLELRGDVVEPTPPPNGGNGSNGGEEPVEEPIDVDTLLRLILSRLDLSVVGPSDEVPRRSLQATAGFELKGEGVGELTAVNTPYQLNISLVDRQDGSEQPAGATEGQLQDQQETYQSTIIFPIPKSGAYTLRGTVTLEDAAGNELSASRDGRNFTVS